MFFIEWRKRWSEAPWVRGLRHYSSEGRALDQVYIFKCNFPDNEYRVVGE